MEAVGSSRRPGAAVLAIAPLLALVLGVSAWGCATPAKQPAPPTTSTLTLPVRPALESDAISAWVATPFPSATPAETPAPVESGAAVQNHQFSGRLSPKEVERVRAIRVQPADRLSITATVWSGWPEKAHVTVTSPRKTDAIADLAFRVKVARTDGAGVVFDRQPEVIGPSPTQVTEGDRVFSGSTAFSIELDYLPDGHYLLTLEYFSEAGVRAAIIEQPFVVPGYQERAPKPRWCDSPP